MTAYSAEQLGCVVFQLDSDGSLVTEVAGRERRERVGWTGRLVVQGRPVVGGVGLTLWFDQLSLWRDAPEGRIEPDASGLLGGRYQGTLGVAGGYRAERVPFLPDGVSEVVRLEDLPADLLPPLPRVALAIGQTWRDSADRRITRLDDSVARDGGVLRRYRSTLERQAVVSLPRLTEDDTVAVAGQEDTHEDGAFVWQADVGLLRRERRLVVETVMSPSLALGGGLRSRLNQHIVLRREASGRDCEPAQ